mgnify:CR=1 FL=1
MAAVLVGGIILIWLALSGGRAVLNGAGIQLHRPAAMAAPLLLAALESAFFLLTLPTTPLLDESLRWPAAGALTVLAWAINGAMAGRLYLKHSR